jgi:hypothetical protein
MHNAANTSGLGDIVHGKNFIAQDGVDQSRFSCEVTSKKRMWVGVEKRK